jgi:ferredoxin
MFVSQVVQGRWLQFRECGNHPAPDCRETAPANFTRSDDGGYSYVFKQPTTPEEEALCKEAMEGCPVEAIDNNGEG